MKMKNFSLLIDSVKMKGLGRAADHSAALLQTRASAINAHSSSDYGFAESFVAMYYPRGH